MDSRGVQDSTQNSSSSLVKRNKRRGVALSCAECRRLKLKCSRVFPCSNCIKKGCAAICPDGSLTTGQANRFVLANTEALYDKNCELSNRIRQLEDALAESHKIHSNFTHPLLTEDLLQIKQPLERERLDVPHFKEEPDIGDDIDSMRSLSILRGGRSKLFSSMAQSPIPSTANFETSSTTAKMDIMKMFQYPSPAPSSSPAPFSLPTSSVTAYSSSPLVQNLPFQFVSKHHPGQNPPLPEPSQLGSHPYPFSLPTPSEIATPWDLWRDTAKRDIPASQSKYKDSVAPSPTPYQTQYITADRAFAHITAQESAIRHVLALARYAGAYVLQAGFSEEMAHAGLRVEEVYVVLEQEVLEEVPRALAVVFSPFQGVVWTPGETYFVPGEAHGEAQEVFEDKVVGVLVASKGATLGGGGGDGRMATGNGKQVNMQGGDRGGEDDDDDDAMDGGGGNGQGGSDDGGRGGGDEDGGDTGGSGSEGGGGGGSEGGGGGKDGVAGSPRYMNIPLMSTLSTKEDNNSYPHTTKFTAGCCVDITIDANTQAVSPPPGSSWRGPWFRVDMSMLNITTLGAVPDAPWRYTIGLTQVRIMAATHATSIIQSSPANLRAGEDSAKTKAERTQTGGAWVTLSGTPNLRMGGTSARTAGSEGMQRRWEVITHPVNGEGGTGVLWKYSHNDRDGVFERVAAENFEPRPAATFGLGKALPVLEVGVVAYWSSIPSSRAQVRGLFQFMRMRGKEQAALPAFANFLHQASMEVDLAKVSEGSSWIVGANLSDEQTISGLRKAGGAVHFEPTAWTASNSQPLESVCEVVFRRAIEGRISELTEGERLALVAVRVNDPGTIRGAIQR